MGGGDLACIFLFKLPGETSRPGEFRGLPYPFPVEFAKIGTQNIKKKLSKGGKKIPKYVDWHLNLVNTKYKTLSKERSYYTYHNCLE